MGESVYSYATFKIPRSWVDPAEKYGLVDTDRESPAQEHRNMLRDLLEDTFNYDGFADFDAADIDGEPDAVLYQITGCVNYGIGPTKIPDEYIGPYWCKTDGHYEWDAIEWYFDGSRLHEAASSNCDGTVLRELDWDKIVAEHPDDPAAIVDTVTRYFAAVSGIDKADITMLYELSEAAIGDNAHRFSCGEVEEYAAYLRSIGWNKDWIENFIFFHATGFDRYDGDADCDAIHHHYYVETYGCAYCGGPVTSKETSA